MKIVLWILVDNYGRIFYTGHTKQDIENNKHLFPEGNIVRLEGEINEEVSSSRNNPT